MKASLQKLSDSTVIRQKGDINNLPVELLSRIFQVGTWSGDRDQEKDRTVDAQEILCELEARIAHDRNNDSDEELEEDGEEWTDDGDGDGDDVGGKSDEEEERDEERSNVEVGGEEETDEENCADDATAFSDSTVLWTPVLPPFEIVVSHVCRHWRNVALSTPSLWTTIEVSPEARPPYEHESTLLQRSKSLPIDIYIKSDVLHEEATSDANLVLLFAMLVPHVHRWRTMRFPIIKYSHMQELLNAVSNPSIPAASRLMTLQLYALGGAFEFDSTALLEHPGVATHSTLFSGSVPLLTRLVLWGVHVDWSQPWIISAPNLTDLELSFHAEAVRPSWTQLIAILRGAAPALQRLTLSGSGPSGDPDQWFTRPTPGSPADLEAPIRLPRLTKLVIGYYSQARAIGLVRRFHLPALKHLFLCFDGEDFTDLVYELARPAASDQGQPQSLLGRLEGLKIKRLPCDIGCIDTLYGELENLASLNICVSPPLLSRFFLDLLSTPGRSTGRVWLPRLVTLCVSGASGEDLREVVTKRRDAGVPLSSLYVQTSRELSYEDVVWLTENVKTLKFFEMDMDY